MAPFTQSYEEAKVKSLYRVIYFILKVIYSAKVRPQGMVDALVEEFMLNSALRVCAIITLVAPSPTPSFHPSVVLVIYCLPRLLFLLSMFLPLLFLDNES